MKRPLALLALAVMHAKNGNQRRALAAVTAAAEDEDADAAVEAINDAVTDDDDLPSELDDVVESDAHDTDANVNELVDDVDALDEDEIAELADAVIDEDGLNVGADDLDLDSAESVVASLLDAGAHPSTLRRTVRNLLIAGVDGMGEDDLGGDLQGFDASQLDEPEEELSCGTPVRTTASTKASVRDMQTIIAANLRALASR